MTSNSRKRIGRTLAIFWLLSGTVLITVSFEGSGECQNGRWCESSPVPPRDLCEMNPLCDPSEMDPLSCPPGYLCAEWYTEGATFMCCVPIGYIGTSHLEEVILCQGGLAPRDSDL